MSKKIDQYTVKADRKTGEWIGEPIFVSVVNQSEWSKLTDTDFSHFDTYEVPSDDGVSTITRAIEVVWVE